MPIKFEIYRQGARLTAFEPIAAAAIGPESVPISGDVSFKDGLLVVNRKDDHPIGVSLLWDCGAMGTFHLETTRLQPRERPYILNVELARFRLMKIMQKQEDWNLFDFPKTEKYQQKFHEATMLFAEALGKLDNAAEASKLADRALETGVDLSEQLSLFHSELLLNRRRSGTTSPSGPPRRLSIPHRSPSPWGRRARPAPRRWRCTPTGRWSTRPAR